MKGRLPPTPMERAPEVALERIRIPKERYTSPGYMEREQAQLWPRVWLLAAFESDMADPGDYTTYEVARESILIVRQRGGSFAAFHNVCLHRGNRLVEPGRGNARNFTCLFHGWRYKIDGELDAALDEETFRQGCSKEELSLKPVRCGRWGGFIWINLDPDGESLEQYLDVIPRHLDPYHFEEMKIVGEYTIEIDCNWKTKESRGSSSTPSSARIFALTSGLRSSDTRS